MIKALMLIAIMLIGTFAWACCMAATTSDEEAERMYQEYLEHKYRREVSCEHAGDEERGK